MNSNNNNKAIAFSKKEIESLTRNRPAYLEVTVDKTTNTVSFIGEGEAHDLTLAYGPSLTLVSAFAGMGMSPKTKLFSSVDEVLAFLGGRDIRSQRDKDTFSRMALEYLSDGNPLDASQLVPLLLLCEPKAGDGDFERGRRWLNEMSAEGLLYRESVKVPGKRGKGVIMYYADSPKAKAAREAEKAAKEQEKTELEAYAEKLGGKIDLENMSLILNVKELDEAFANQLVLV